MTRKKKLLVSAVVVGVLGSVAALGVFGLFSATTQNAGNEISTGTVALSDNDAGQAMFNVTGARPGDSWTRCIKVTYGGTLPTDVHMYLRRTPGPLESYLTMTVVQGTQASPVFPDCTGFTPDATGTIFAGPMTLADGDFVSGLATVPAGQSVWQPGDALAFKVTMALSSAAPDAVQGASTGTVAAVWEAHNDE